MTVKNQLKPVISQILTDFDRAYIVEGSALYERFLVIISNLMVITSTFFQLLCLLWRAFTRWLYGRKENTETMSESSRTTPDAGEQ